MTAAPRRLVSDGNQSWRRFALTLLIYFGCLIVVGLIWYIVLVTTLCFMAPSNRCFSASQDTVFFIRIWFVPSLAGACVTAVIERYRGWLAWWHAFVLMPLALVIVGVADGMPTDLILVPVVLLMMIVGAQTAWLFLKSMYATDRGA